MTKQNAPSNVAIATLDRLAYKPNNAAQLLDISRARVFELMRTGELASVRYGRTRLIPRTAIEEFLSADQAA